MDDGGKFVDDMDDEMYEEENMYNALREHEREQRDVESPRHVYNQIHFPFSTSRHVTVRDEKRAYRRERLSTPNTATFEEGNMYNVLRELEKGQREPPSGQEYSHAQFPVKTRQRETIYEISTLNKVGFVLMYLNVSWMIILSLAANSIVWSEIHH